MGNDTTGQVHVSLTGGGRPAVFVTVECKGEMNLTNDEVRELKQRLATEVGLFLTRIDRKQECRP
jgi:hypothetical protein